MRRLTFLGAILAALALPAAASGDQGYEAQWITQSPYLTLESGETATSSFTARNIGTATWSNSIVNLGTANPRDRSSGMYNPAD